MFAVEGKIISRELFNQAGRESTNQNDITK
jgi:hypothetical protein